MRRSHFDPINDKPSANTIYDNNNNILVSVINAPNKIPSLQLKLEINKTTGYLSIGDIINCVVSRYNSLGLTDKFPQEHITILIDGTPYDIKSKNTQVPHNGRLSEISIKLPKEIDKKYLMAQQVVDESTTLNGRPKPSSWWWPFS